MTPEDRVAELARGFKQELAFEQKLMEGEYDDITIARIGLAVPLELLAIVCQEVVKPHHQHRVRQLVNEALDEAWEV